jgi:hypothetical protein
MSLIFSLKCGWTDGGCAAGLTSIRELQFGLEGRTYVSTSSNCFGGYPHLYDVSQLNGETRRGLQRLLRFRIRAP